MAQRFDDGISEDEAEGVCFTGQGYMLNRGGEPVEVAAPALFLLSDDASYITGSDFMADGGFITMGSQGSMSKAERDFREYGKPICYGKNWSSFEPSVSEDAYPELFKENPAKK